MLFIHSFSVSASQSEIFFLNHTPRRSWARYRNLSRFRSLKLDMPAVPAQQGPQAKLQAPMMGIMVHAKRHGCSKVATTRFAFPHRKHCVSVVMVFAPLMFAFSYFFFPTKI